jgi:hypothetical protein
MLAALRPWLLLLAVVACAVNMPLMNTASMPDAVAYATNSSVAGSDLAHQAPSAECCSLQAAPVSAALLTPILMAAAVLLIAAHRLHRGVAPGPPGEPVPLFGLAGRPLLFAYLN